MGALQGVGKTRQRRRPSSLELVEVDSGLPATDALRDSIVLASSRGLGWDGVVAERWSSLDWSLDGLAPAGHFLAIYLGDAPLVTEAQGPRGVTRRLIPPGSLWIQPAGAPFSMRNLGRCQWGAIELSVEKARRALGRDLELCPRAGVLDQPLAALARALLHEAESRGESGALFADALAIAVAWRLAHHAGLGGSRLAPGGGISARRLKRVTEKIESALAERITVGALAAVAGLSPAHFAREFKRCTHETPHAFVMHFRLERAREQLADGSSIAAAATACGFSDQPHLSRMFKRRFGLTPAAFVRQVRR